MKSRAEILIYLQDWETNLIKSLSSCYSSSIEGSMNLTWGFLKSVCKRQASILMEISWTKYNKYKDKHGLNMQTCKDDIWYGNRWHGCKKMINRVHEGVHVVVVKIAILFHELLKTQEKYLNIPKIH